MSRPCVWLHDAALNPDDPALRAEPTAAVVFVFDEPALRGEPWAFHRLAFVFDGVCELFAGLPHPVKEVRRGETAAEVLAFCREHGCDAVHATDHADPFVRGVLARLGRELPVTVYPRDQLAEYAEEPRRFTRYWDRVARQVLGYTPRPRGR